jgi:hypothetical protein
MARPLLVLNRESSGADGTFGKLILPIGTGSLWWYTAEEEWKQNARSVSCIPLGLYPLRRTIYQRHQLPTFEVCDVPGRSRILIHPGNTEEDTQGCVLIGMALGFTTVVEDEDTGLKEVRKQAVLESKRAFADFMRRMEGIEDAQLRVIGVAG